MAAYPSLAIGIDGFQELPRGYATIKTPYEQGYVQTRSKSTTAPRRFTLLHDKVTAADVATFLTFWDARKGGAEAFDFTDPRTSTVVSVRFDHDEKNPPRIAPIASANVGFTIGPIQLEEAL